MMPHCTLRDIDSGENGQSGVKMCCQPDSLALHVAACDWLDKLRRVLRNFWHVEALSSSICLPHTIFSQ